MKGISEIEKKIIDFIKENMNFLFLFAITVLGCAVRIAGRNFISGDMSYFLVPWYNTIKEAGGLSSLKQPVGNYGLLYMTIIALLSYIDMNCVHLYKMLSILFDFLLALASAYLVYTSSKDSSKKAIRFSITYAVVFLLPTVAANSAFWGQCDSIYTFFVIMVLICMMKEKFVWAFCLFGIALAFKLQAIFILPFLVCYYLYSKKFSLLMFGYSLLCFWGSGIAAYLQGRGLLDGFLIYLEQTDTYHNISMGFPGFFLMFAENYESLKVMAIVTALAACGIGVLLIISMRINLSVPENFLSAAAWFVWTCIIFLPAMHERYGYLCDILLIVIAVLNKKNLKYAVIVSVISMMTYGFFLFGSGTITIYHSIVYFAAYAHFTYHFFGESKIKNI